MSKRTGQTGFIPGAGRRHVLVPVLVLLIGGLATLAAAVLVRTTATARDEVRFDAEVDRATAAVADRVETQVALLRGAAGLFAADPNVTGDEFSRYVERLALAHRYPGVLGIGYSARARGDAERAALVARMWAQGARDFHTWPAASQPPYHAILYLSPMNARNHAALGFDMFTEPTRRAAMTRARDTGQAALSGKVLLVQEISAQKQPGFLIYLPIYVGGDLPDTPDARGRRLQGFVYSPLRAHDLLSTVFRPGGGRAVDVAIYDGAAAADNLLYSTRPGGGPRPAWTAARTVSLEGRPWTVVVTSTPIFEAQSARGFAVWTGLVGLLITAVLAMAVVRQARFARVAERAGLDLRRLNETLEQRVGARTGELVAANAVLRQEIERREAAEGQVRQMQKLESVGQLAGGVAHDFNNMLAIVLGSLDLARRRLARGEPERVEAYLASATEGAQRAALLTERLLAFSRRQPLSPRPIDANQLVGGMSELFSRALGEQVRIETVLAPGLWLTHADPGQLENAILNLAVNARDAMPEGGRLTIETANSQLDAREAAAAGLAPGPYVSICVTDTGVGMAADVVERAFDPFFTTKRVGKGTGLGLSQVHGFVNQSGGRVSLESEVGNGTTVRIHLPRWFGAAAPEPAAPPSGEAPRADAHEVVLVVEDEAEVRRLSIEALRDLGYEVAAAAGGVEALQQLARLPRVDLLFTDVVMPDMNGPRLASEALASRPDLRILYTTGYAPNTVLDPAALEGAALLQKPFTTDELARKVREVLDGSGPKS